MMGPRERSGAPPSSRPTFGWVWHFFICGRTADRRRWVRVELEVAGRYPDASARAKGECLSRRVFDPLVLGVRRARAAQPTRERWPTIDARF